MKTVGDHLTKISNMSRKKACEFYELVKSMRSYQKMYFAAAKDSPEKKDFLQKSKQFEYKVDYIIRKTEEKINGRNMFNQT